MRGWLSFEMESSSGSDKLPPLFNVVPIIVGTSHETAGAAAGAKTGTAGAGHGETRSAGGGGDSRVMAVSLASVLWM
jgi:hypothetical protein